jgi:hypothetical protein
MGILAVMAHRHVIHWPARQMYSREAPIGRDQIFAAFAGLLHAATGVEVSPPEKIASVDVPGVDEYLGYWAAQETYRLTAGDAALVCTIDPILASMGVSGEHHVWSSEGLALTVRGVALSSGRQPSSVEVVLEGATDERAAELLTAFASAFPAIMNE